jgi:hypothetical protein
VHDVKTWTKRAQLKPKQEQPPLNTQHKANNKQQQGVKKKKSKLIDK